MRPEDLREVRLLAALDDRQLAGMMDAMSETQYPQYGFVFKEGDEGEDEEMEDAEATNNRLLGVIDALGQEQPQYAAQHHGAEAVRGEPVDDRLGLVWHEELVVAAGDEGDVVGDELSAGELTLPSQLQALLVQIEGPTGGLVLQPRRIQVDPLRVDDLYELLFLLLQVPVVAAEVAQQYEAVVTVEVVDWVVT